MITSLWSLTTESHTPMVNRNDPNLSTGTSTHLNMYFVKMLFMFWKKLTMSVGKRGALCEHYQLQGRKTAFPVEHLHSHFGLWARKVLLPPQLRGDSGKEKLSSTHTGGDTKMSLESNSVSEQQHTQCYGAKNLGPPHNVRQGTPLRKLSVNCFMRIKWHLDNIWEIK